MTTHSGASAARLPRGGARPLARTRKYLAPAGWVIAAAVAALGFWADTGRAARAETGLTVPAGFTVERVAGPPLVDRPIVADFDEEGRLYVADSSGSNDKTDKQLVDKPHRIVRLEDKDGDGRFDTSVVFADRMMFPEGTMWFDGSLYVAAPPSIWKLTDTDGDGVADRREEWFQGKTLTGCANDLHGPYLGPDGWIYWTKGAFAQQTYERPGRAPLVTKASHIFRRRPGDTAIESVMSGGMDNPVDVDFTAAGQRILTATFLEHPQLGRRDAVLHAVYGGVYGKPHAVIDGHQRTGDLMPVMSQLGPAVPSGLTRYASRVFGDEYRDNFFATMFNLHKVSRYVLEPSGATFTSRDSDFLVSASLDFHPTDVLEDADGSLLVVDTGGWYKLCCPTSQLAKPEVLGAVYRVRREGAAAVRDPRGRTLPWATMTPAALTRLLDDRRPAVQKRALHRFGQRGGAAVPALRGVLRSPASAEARRNAVWALTRIDGPEARDAIRGAVADRDADVQQAALHSIGLWRDTASLPQVRAALSRGPAIQRAAAEALGRIGDARAVPDLMTAAAGPGDRVLEHALTYALIEIAEPASTAASLASASSSRATRAGLIALDQMDGGGVQSDRVIPLLDSADVVLRESAWWIAGQHPAWGAQLEPFFRRQLAAAGADAAKRDDLAQKLARFAADPAIQTLLAETAVEGGSPAARAVGLRAMAAAAKSPLKELPRGWIAPLGRVAAGDDAAAARTALAVFRGAPAAKDAVADVKDTVMRLARDATRPAELRLDALGAVPGRLERVDADSFELLRGSLGPEQPALVRAAAAAIVERASLDARQLAALTEIVRTAGPLELARMLPAFDQGGDEAVGLQLVAALEQSKSRSALRADLVRPRLAKYPPTVQQRGEALIAAVHADAAQQARRMEELLPAMQGGDVRRGQLVFNGQKAACMTCHTMGYAGGKVGPDLTRIGQVRSERDLLEAIVFPNASFARSYEPIVITTKSGAIHAGVLRSDLSDEVVVATGAPDDIRIPRAAISDMRPGEVSVMPPGYADQLSRQELADLVAFLKAAKPAN